MRYGLFFVLLSFMVSTSHADDGLPQAYTMGAPGSAPDAQGWWLIKDDRHRDIRCYARQEDHKHQRSFRVEATIAGKPEDLAQLLLGFGDYSKWFWNVKDSRLLKQVSATEYYLYVVHEAPYPMGNRDSVLHIQVKPQSAGDKRLILVANEAAHFYPAQPDLVRMPAEDFTMVFTPLPDDRIQVQLAGYLDMGADTPDWAANFVQDAGPYYSIRGMQRMVQEPRTISGRGPLPFPVYSYKELGSLAIR